MYLKTQYNSFRCKAYTFALLGLADIADHFEKMGKVMDESVNISAGFDRFLGISKTILLICFVLSQTSCANHFKQFYHPYPQIDIRTVVACGSDPAVSTIKEEFSKSVIFKLAMKGYMPIGYSSFSSTNNETKENLLEHARDINACLVLVHTEYGGTVHGVYPIFDYQPPERYRTSFSGTHGNMSFSGQAITQAGSGSITTTWIPYTKEKTNYYVCYFAKARQPILGALSIVLPDDIRKSLQRNTGAFVLGVREGSPAFTADIMPGDVIIKTNNSLINSPNDLKAFNVSHQGEDINITILREGKEIVRHVKLNTL